MKCRKINQQRRTTSPIPIDGPTSSKLNAPLNFNQRGFFNRVRIWKTRNPPKPRKSSEAKTPEADKQPDSKTSEWTVVVRPRPRRAQKEGSEGITVMVL